MKTDHVVLRFLKLSFVSLSFSMLKWLLLSLSPTVTWQDQFWIFRPKTEPNIGTHCVCRKKQKTNKQKKNCSDSGSVQHLVWAFIFCLFYFRLYFSGTCSSGPHDWGTFHSTLHKLLGKLLNSDWGEIWLCSRVSPSLQFTQVSGNC